MGGAESTPSSAAIAAVPNPTQAATSNPTQPLPQQHEENQPHQQGAFRSRSLLPVNCNRCRFRTANQGKTMCQTCYDQFKNPCPSRYGQFQQNYLSSSSSSSSSGNYHFLPPIQQQASPSYSSSFSSSSSATAAASSSPSSLPPRPQSFNPCGSSSSYSYSSYSPSPPAHSYSSSATAASSSSSSYSSFASPPSFPSPPTVASSSSSSYSSFASPPSFPSPPTAASSSSSSYPSYSSFPSPPKANACPLCRKQPCSPQLSTCSDCAVKDLQQALERQEKEFKHQEEQRKQRQEKEVKRHQEERMRQEEEIEKQKAEIKKSKAPPAHWMKTSINDPTIFVPLPSSSTLYQNIADSFEKTKLVKPPGTLNAGMIEGGPDCPELLHDSFQIGNVWHIENSDCWKAYKQQRKVICKSLLGNQVLQSKFVPLNPALRTSQHEHSFVEAQQSGVLEWAEKALELNSSTNETLLFHGLKDEKTARTVAREGFDPRVAHLHNVFGSGIYATDRSSKAEEYCEEDSSGSCFLLLARVTLGVMHVQHTWLTFPDSTESHTIVRRPFCVEGHNLALQGHKQFCDHDLTHSTLGMPTRKVGQLYREFVVYEKNQLYPEFMVEFKRVTKKSQQQQQQQQQLLLPRLQLQQPKQRRKMCECWGAHPHQKVCRRYQQTRPWHLVTPCNGCYYFDDDFPTPRNNKNSEEEDDV